MALFEKYKKYVFLSLPILLILFFRLVALFIRSSLYSQLGIYMWIPFVVLYWIVLSAMIVIGTPKDKLIGRFQAPQGGKRWSIISVLISLIGLANMIMLLDDYSKMNILIPGLILSVINPWIEESFWRGFLIERLSDFPKAFSIPYINICFALLHLLTIGVISVPNQELVILPITFIVGVIWSVTYLKTNSLRYVVIGHFLLDIFGFPSLFIIS